MDLYAKGGPAWTFCEAEEPGATLVQQEPLPEAGTYRLTGQSSLFDRDGEPHYQQWFVEWSLEQAKAEKLEQVAEAYQTRLSGGYSHNFGDGPEHLQTRGPDDKINWLTFKDSCQDQIDVAGGAYADAPIGLPIRTAENATHTVTANQGKAICVAMRGWVGNVMKWSWDRKDEVEAATSAEDLDNISLDDAP